MLYEYKPNLSSKDQKKLESLGGFDIQDWIRQTEIIGADKKDHKERSIAHQKNHLRHWRKIERGENLWKI